MTCSEVMYCLNRYCVSPGCKAYRRHQLQEYRDAQWNYFTTTGGWRKGFIGEEYDTTWNYRGDGEAT